MNSPVIQNLTKQFQKLPSVGTKTAQRFVYALLKDPANNNLEQLESALKRARENISICKKCFNISEGNLCNICANPSRDPQTICIVEEALDIPPIEECGEFNGVYYVIGTGKNSHISSLIQRINNEDIKEIIIASNPSSEGEAVALKLQKIIAENTTQKIREIKITRLGRGLPTGGDIKYADRETIRGALRGRQILS